MDLILWRHADAEDGSPDSQRQLTAKGHKQASRVAAWLRERLPEETRIIVSPAVRAQQTAGALELPFETTADAGPGASATAILAAAGWPDARGTVLVVGHQPTLGEVCAWLLAGEPASWNVKKGAIWWFTRRARGGTSETILRAVAGPDLI